MRFRRNRSSHRVLIAAAAASLAMLSAAPSPSHATLTVDLRALAATGAAIVNNAKSVTVTGPATLTVGVYAVITPAVDDANPLNEGMNSVSGSFLSAGASFPCNFTNSTLNPNFANLGSSIGTIQDLDGDGDLDIGSNSSTISTDYWATRALTAPSSIPGNQHLLGELTVSVNGSLAVTPTSIFLNFRQKSGAPNTRGLWTENGAAVLSNSTNILSGVPIDVLQLPEPASAGLIAIAGLSMLARRRR